MADQIELTQAVVSEPAADKTQVIMSLVAALEAFEASAPVTAFPEDMAEKAKAARSISAELKDDLLLLKQRLDEAAEELGKAQGVGVASAAVSTPTDEVQGRFATRLDGIANVLQAKGMGKLAASIDVVSNTLESSKK